MTNHNHLLPLRRRGRRPRSRQFGPSGRPRTRPHRTGLSVAIAAPCLAVGLLAACGSDDSERAGAAAPSTTATRPASTESAVASDTTVPATDPANHDTAHQQPVVRGGLVDYAFGGLPARVPAGTQLSVTNTSDVELHELVAFRLPDGEQRTIDELLQLAPQEFESIVGHPAMVLIARPGEDGVAALGDGRLTEPGRYVILCGILIGADPDEYLAAAAEANGAPPAVAGGPPHFTQGMVAELSVTP